MDQKIYKLYSNKFTIIEKQTKYGTTYDVRFRVIDKTNKVVHKRLSGYQTKTLAKRGYAEFVDKYCMPYIPGSVEKPQKEYPTLQKVFAEYDQYLFSTVKDSTHIAIRNAFNLHILPFMGNKKMNQITKQLLYKWQDDLLSKTSAKGESYSAKYIKNIKILFNGCLNWYAKRYDWYNPMQNVETPKTTQFKPKTPNIDFWDKKEFERFINQVDEPIYHTLFTLLFYTGCRKGEAIALTPKDYDGEHLTINKTYSRKTIGEPYKITERKNSGNMKVPITKVLKDELDEYIKTINPDDEFLFGGDRPLPETTITRKFNLWCEKAIVPKIRIHGLRHSFVSMCIHNNANYTVIANLIGDSPEQVLKTYGHMWIQDMKTVVDKL